MYPFSVILVNCGEAVRPTLRQMLSNHLAVVEMEFPDVAHAVATLGSHQELLRLFITRVRSIDDFNGLRRLSATFKGSPILALLEKGSDPSLFIGALRAGASLVVPLPLTAEEVSTALDWTAKQCKFTVQTGRLIAVSGVTGGCGSTTIAVNLASEAALLPDVHSILVDLSLKIGVIAANLDLEPNYSLLDLVGQVEDLDIDCVRKVLTPVAGRFQLLAGPHQAISDRTLNQAEVLQILHYARRLAHVLVVDVPCTYDDFQFEVLAAADEVVLVGEQKIPSVRAMKMVEQALARRRDNVDLYVVINRYNPSLSGFTAAKLTRLLGARRLLTVAADSTVDAAANDGRTLRDADPASPALADIDRLLQALMGKAEAEKTAKGKDGLYNRVVRAFGLT